MKRTRAWRRSQQERVNNKAIKKGTQSEWSKENCLKNANHMACCSCYACGNPRRHKFSNKTKLTLQEKIQLEKDSDSSSSEE